MNHALHSTARFSRYLCLLILFASSLHCVALEKQSKASGAAVQERSIFYTSDGLQIRAFVFVPALPGPHPVLLFNHGGMSGVIENSKKRCRELAKLGYLVFASSYRGEDGSQGQIEVALGEVDDVLAGLEHLKSDPRADLNRVGLIGFSHGALVSLQALKRKPKVKAMVFAYGVADLYAWYGYLKASKQLGEDAITKRIYGTGPESRPDDFAKRNGVSNLDLIDSKLPILIVQGAKDITVPKQQALFLDQALKARQQPVKTLIYPNAGHAFLIRWTDLRGPERQDADQAWAQIYAFLKAQL
jgi:dipeptidyl aminopeptidase/acylaminoacyl peptidase